MKHLTKGGENMASEPTTLSESVESIILLEGIIGAEKVLECQKEINTRIRPDDDPYLQDEILRSIVTRYVKERELKLSDIATVLPSQEAERIYNTAFKFLVNSLLEYILIGGDPTKVK